MTNLRAIDVHTHIVPQKFPAYTGVGRNIAWPSMAPAHACHCHVMIQGSVYRTVHQGAWLPDERVGEMDKREVGVQCLSPMPELLSYWMAPDDGVQMCRYLNEVIATMVAKAPTRFFGLGAVPLQDVDAAIRELDVIVNEMGLSGVEIAGSVNGHVIGDARFLPFFEAAAQWGAAVFVHPLRPSGMDRLVGPAALEQVLAFPGETGLAAASLITGGTMDRLPDLRIAFSHGGGTLSALLPRLQHAWKTVPPIRSAFTADPTAVARRMYFDDLVYDAATIHRLIDVFGESQIMAGSDYPFSIMDGDPAGRLESLELPAETLTQLQSANAERWLGLDTR